MLTVSEFNQVKILKTGRDVLCNLARYYAYCFIFEDALIDTSTLHVQHELLKYLKTSRIKQVINTHHHEDHTGNNSAIHQLLGIPIYAPAQAIPLIKMAPPSHQHLYIKIFWGYPKHSFIPSELGSFINIGNYRFEIIATPGHSDDHVCIYSPELQIIFTGDVFCGARVKYLRADEDFNKQLETIRKLSKLDIETIFCSVSGVVPNGQQALKTKLDFMEELKDKVINLNHQGYSVIEIRNQVLGREGTLNWLSNGHFSKLNTIKSILNL